LGPSGCGAAILLQVLAGRVRPSAGRAVVAGVDPVRDALELRRRVSYVPPGVGLPADLTLEEFLLELAALDGQAAPRDRVDQALDAVGLSAVRRHRLSALSGGMKRRALLAQGLLADTPVVLVDTPTAGLDPWEQVLVLRLLRDLSATRTLVVATNIPGEAVQLPGRLLVMDGGRVVADRSSSTLAKAAEGHAFQLPWSFRGVTEGWWIPSSRPEYGVVVAPAAPHAVAEPVASTPDLGYLWLLWQGRHPSGGMPA
jgi:ABC-2 type transport system ATP-binding protein